MSQWDRFLVSPTDRPWQINLPKRETSKASLSFPMLKLREKVYHQKEGRLPMKTERLLSIIILLLQRKRVTAKELAEQLEVSIRTIYRDIESINAAGIPIISHQGVEGGYEILSSFMLQNQALNQHDRNLLISTIKGITSLFDDTKIVQMAESLGSTRGKNSKENIDPLSIVIDFAPWGLPNIGIKLLTSLKKAMEQKREVHFFYVDGNGIETKRQVQPASIIVKAGIPYFYGYCLSRKAARVFRVSRMRELVLTGNKFELPVDFNIDAKSLEKSWVESSEMISLSLLFQPKVKVFVEEQFTTDQITRLDSGMIKVDCQFPKGDWVKRFLLSFGTDVTILEPKNMRDTITEEARKISQLYE
jgi:predicted DNA-binding transcriptional regulator YafY